MIEVCNSEKWQQIIRRQTLKMSLAGLSQNKYMKLKI